MSYMETHLPDELRRSLQEMFGTSQGSPRTLGEFARDYPQLVGVPEAEAFISEEPTRHEARLEGMTLYTHCFIDALMLPFMLRTEPVEIRSESPDSGETITAIATQEVVKGSPPGAVMSFGAALGVSGEVQQCVCPYVNAFTSQEEYERWKSNTPQAATVSLPLPEAFAFARDMIGRLEMPEGWGADLNREGGKDG